MCMYIASRVAVFALGSETELARCPTSIELHSEMCATRREKLRPFATATRPEDLSRIEIRARFWDSRRGLKRIDDAKVY